MSGGRRPGFVRFLCKAIVACSDTASPAHLAHSMTTASSCGIVLQYYAVVLASRDRVLPDAAQVSLLSRFFASVTQVTPCGLARLLTM